MNKDEGWQLEHDEGWDPWTDAELVHYFGAQLVREFGEKFFIKLIADCGVDRAKERAVQYKAWWGRIKKLPRTGDQARKETKPLWHFANGRWVPLNEAGTEAVVRSKQSPQPKKTKRWMPASETSAMNEGTEDLELWGNAKHA